MSFLSYTLIYILHPILHPKLSVNSESLRQGVGNVVFFTKLFWGGENAEMGCIRDRVKNGNRKHRASLRKTSVLSRQNIGTFPQRSPMFFVSERGTMGSALEVFSY